MAPRKMSALQAYVKQVATVLHDTSIAERVYLSWLFNEKETKIDVIFWYCSMLTTKMK